MVLNLLNQTVTSGLLGGSNGLRGGRQKGIESTVNTPNLSLKFDYYGLAGLRLGLAGYFGKTQAPDDVDKIDGADVGMAMVGFDARYAYKKFMARGQYIVADLSGTSDYNTLTGQNLGSQLQGYYVEGAYNILPSNKTQKLFAFKNAFLFCHFFDVSNGSWRRSRKVLITCWGN